MKNAIDMTKMIKDASRKQFKNSNTVQKIFRDKTKYNRKSKHKGECCGT